MKPEVKLKLLQQKTILDLGCGDGELTSQIADPVLEGKLVGIDA